MLNSDDILFLGLSSVGYTPAKCNAAAKLEKFRGLYGVEPQAMQDIWTDICTDIVGDAKIVKAKITHLLMTIYWLKAYETEEGVLRTFNIQVVSRMTFRKYNNMILKALQALSRAKIVWPFDGNNRDATVFFGSIDGIHCPIEEPRKFPSTKWYSHKTNGPGLTYQIVLSLHENKVLSIVGPHPAGVPDLQVFRLPGGIFESIPAGKRLIGDRGYSGEPHKIATPNEHDAQMTVTYKNRARARHETFNKRLKDFKALDETFRHSRNRTPVENFDEHQAVFESVCIVAQYNLQYKPLFEI